jgi:ribosomal protein S25
MADAFEREIEELVSRVAGVLARDIAGLILRRLGIENGEAHGWVQPAAPAKRRGRPAAAAAPASVKPARAKRGGKRTRASSGEMADRVERVAKVIDQSEGVSSSDIEKKAKLSRNVVQAAIRTLREEGRIFMGGTKRFARYASTQKQADSASVAAHG